MKSSKIHNLHGGDLDEISRIYGIPKEDILNFSGNVNPLGLPPSVKEAISLNLDAPVNYPDVSYVELRESIAGYTNTKADNIIVGNGSTELISLFIKTLAPKNAVIVSPAYSEYLREIELCGGSAQLFPLKSEEEFMLNIDELKVVLSDDVKLLVICNPNNPTGTYINCAQTGELLEHCRKNGTFIMIDETYVEFSDTSKEVSAMPLVNKFDNLFIIRGTSKFFACPGLRLGYAACSNSRITEYINTHKDPWSVNIFAEISGKVMFNDREFEEKTKKLISRERERIFDALKQFKNIHVYDTQSNFFLCKLLRDDITSDMIFDELIKHNILIRDASDFPYLGSRYLRFCILDKESNSLLLTKLKEILE